jgi:glycine oxidase
LTSTGVELVVGERRDVFDRVILCAGAWTPQLDPTGRTAGRIRPVRGQLVKVKADEVTLPAVLWSRDCYIVPWSDGTLLVGATAEDVGFDERATAGGVRQMLDAAQVLVPSLASATFVEVRVGLRPEAVGGMPLLGPSSDPRLIYAAGHFRNGILLAPLTARLIANHVFDDATDPAFSTT